MVQRRWVIANDNYGPTDGRQVRVGDYGLPWATWTNDPYEEFPAFATWQEAMNYVNEKIKEGA